MCVWATVIRRATPGGCGIPSPGPVDMLGLLMTAYLIASGGLCCREQPLSGFYLLQLNQALLLLI